MCVCVPLYLQGLLSMPISQVLMSRCTTWWEEGRGVGGGGRGDDVTNVCVSVWIRGVAESEKGRKKKRKSQLSLLMTICQSSSFPAPPLSSPCLPPQPLDSYRTSLTGTSNFCNLQGDSFYLPVLAFSFFLSFFLKAFLFMQEHLSRSTTSSFIYLMAAK